jgi:O-Antigen ligase
MSATSVAELEREARRRWTLANVAVWLLGAAVVAAFPILLLSPAGPFSALALAVVVGVVLARPTAGVYLAIFFTLVGDARTAWWYPFAKNLSSRESVLYLGDQLSVSPLEIVLLATAGSWVLSMLGDHHWRFHRGTMLVPLLVFTVFVIFGLVHGYMDRGSTNVALWEARPLTYLPLVYVLVTNLFTSTRQYVIAMWVAMIAVTLQSVLALGWYRSLPPADRIGLDSLTEHSGAVHWNALIIMLLVVWLLPGSPKAARILLPVMAVPVLWAYFVAERRSAMVGLAFGVILLTVFLYQLHRKAFWFFVLTVTPIAFLYVVAFWTNQSAIGFPAQAIKSAIAPGQLEGADRTSVVYRELEAKNVWFTLRENPLLGIGFGQPFRQLYQMPDISFFAFWQYMPHHSFLWVWLKVGYGGFVSMLYIVVSTIQRGVRSVLFFRSRELQVITIVATLYIVMYLVFSYVDIAWDTRSMVFAALAIAICADMRFLVPDDTVEAPDRVARDVVAV